MKAARSSRGGATVEDVARAAGVSAMTVSRVVNGSARVRPATRAAVEAAIETLQYRPNQAARNLAAGRAAQVGLLYANPSDAYLSQFLIGALEGARTGGCHLILEQLDDADLPGAGAIAELFVSAEVRGILVPPPISEMPVIHDALAMAGIPWVAVGVSRPRDGVVSIRISDRDAAYAMTRHLLELGHRTIAFIRGHATLTASVERFEGYAAALHDFGLHAGAMLVEQGHFTFRSGIEATERILAASVRPTAIFASNDDMAAAAIGVAHRLGLSVPRDISVVGFDDTALATTVWPSLTTIRQPTADMARRGAELLIAKPDRKTPAGDQDILVPFELIVRESSGPPHA